MANRRGLGTGKGKGWKNILGNDSHRHNLSRLGVKSKVSITKSQRSRLKKKLLPLLHNQTISGYNVIDVPPHLMKAKKYRLIYGHEVKKHGNKILEEMGRRKINYFVVPRESFFMDDEAFVKSPNQVRKEDIVEADKEFQIVAEVNRKQLIGFEGWLHQKAVNWGVHLQILDGMSPLTPTWEAIPLKDSWTTPDIRIQNRKKFDRFKNADKVIKQLDKDSYLIILSTKKPNTEKLRKLLKGEKVKKVLIQDYTPERHSLYNFIDKNTR